MVKVEEFNKRWFFYSNKRYEKLLREVGFKKDRGTYTFKDNEDIKLQTIYEIHHGVFKPKEIERVKEVTGTFDKGVTSIFEDNPSDYGFIGCEIGKLIGKTKKEKFFVCETNQENLIKTVTEFRHTLKEWETHMKLLLETCHSCEDKTCYGKHIEKFCNFFKLTSKLNTYKRTFVVDFLDRIREPISVPRTLGNVHKHKKYLKKMGVYDKERNEIRIRLKDNLWCINLNESTIERTGINGDWYTWKKFRVLPSVNYVGSVNLSSSSVRKDIEDKYKVTIGGSDKDYDNWIVLNDSHIKANVGKYTTVSHLINEIRVEEKQSDFLPALERYLNKEKYIYYGYKGRIIPDTIILTSASEAFDIMPADKKIIAGPFKFTKNIPPNELNKYLRKRKYRSGEEEKTFIYDGFGGRYPHVLILDKDDENKTIILRTTAPNWGESLREEITTPYQTRLFPNTVRGLGQLLGSEDMKVYTIYPYSCKKKFRIVHSKPVQLGSLIKNIYPTKIEHLSPTKIHNIRITAFKFINAEDQIEMIEIYKREKEPQLHLLLTLTVSASTSDEKKREVMMDVFEKMKEIYGDASKHPIKGTGVSLSKCKKNGECEFRDNARCQLDGRECG